MRFVLALGLVATAAFATLALPTSMRLAERSISHDPTSALSLAIGIVAGAVVSFLGRYVSSVRFVDTFCHELAHACWAVLVGGSVRSFHATADSGGLTEFAVPSPFGFVRSFLVAIAPYWFCPLIPIGLLVFVSLGPLRGGALVCAGALFGFVLMQPLLQWRVSQPDLKAYGVIPPLAVAAWLWAAVLTIGLSMFSAGSTRGLRLVFVASCKSVGVQGTPLLGPVDRPRKAS